MVRVTVTRNDRLDPGAGNRLDDSLEVPVAEIFARIEDEETAAADQMRVGAWTGKEAGVLLGKPPDVG